MNQKPSDGSKWLRPFLLVWIGQAFSTLGSILVQFSLVWWMAETTGSAYVLTTASLVAFLPEVIISPFAGALVDRWKRKVVMIAADSLVALATAGLIILFAAGVIQPWHIYIAMFVRSIGGIFHWTAMQTSTSLMVPEKQLARVNGLNQSLRGGLNIAGPLLGALLLGFLPVHLVLSVDVVTAALAVGMLLLVQIPQPANVDQTPVTFKSVFVDVAAGFRYMRAWTGMMLLVIMAVMLNFLLGPTNALLPLVVKRHFAGDVWHLSTIQSAVGFGVVAGGLVLTVWGGTRKKMYTSLMGVVGMGVSMLLIAYSPQTMFWMAVVGVFLAGFMNPITNGPIFAVVQAKVQPEMQGRVFTLISSFASLMVPLSMAAGGPVSELIGIKTWYWIGGIGCLVVTAGAVFVPALRDLEDQKDPWESRPEPGPEPEPEAAAEPAAL